MLMMMPARYWAAGNNVDPPLNRRERVHFVAERALLREMPGSGRFVIGA